MCGLTHSVLLFRYIWKGNYIAVEPYYWYFITIIISFKDTNYYQLNVGILLFIRNFPNNFNSEYFLVQIEQNSLFNSPVSYSSFTHGFLPLKFILKWFCIFRILGDNTEDILVIYPEGIL